MEDLTEKQSEYLKIMENASVVYLTNIDKNGFLSTRAIRSIDKSIEKTKSVAK
jgi:hypothetical protein